MPPDTGRTLRAVFRLHSTLAAALLLAACAAPVPVPAPPPSAVVAPTAEAVPPPASGASELLAYADRVRVLGPTELALEISRRGEPADAPLASLELALALAQTRSPPNLARAQALVQRVLAQNGSSAQELQSLARLLASQIGQQLEARRLEEQAERQAQQLRDSQRRIDALNDRLEAVRAIERSLPSRPAASAPRP
ncbi:hypothetical protein [uncultured Ramlibacter sp.]|uniref:hypothetical protein n=1 Tax=uncultured Ramlibacter sp. TaxID=260755 RepID=UPI0026311E84|nr:hypothetical protein [uncultured Ramlibacter sp.]